MNGFGKDKYIRMVKRRCSGMNDNLDTIRQQMKGQKGERIMLKMRCGRRGGILRPGRF